MRIALTFILLVSQAVMAQSHKTLTLCELLAHAGEHDGEVVTVRATLKYGFEVQQLYCLSCRDGGKVWLQLLDDSDTARIERLTKGMGIVNLTVTGRFATGGHYGHLRYPHQIAAEKIERVVLVTRRLKPAELKNAEEKWACGGSRPR